MKIYKVGGAVRDKLLNQPVKDNDWVVVGASTDIMLANGYQPVGAEFPVFLHPITKEEYALARTERKTGKGYGGFTFFAGPNVTLEQDLSRRDLTINAIAEDEKGNLYDPYNGQRDIEQRVLRHVSDAFIEDPLRVLRVARFAARFAHLGFTIANETLALMTQLSIGGELSDLTFERVWKEFSRALMEPSPEVFLTVLETCQALHVLLPELTDLSLVTKALQKATEQQQPLTVRWALLMTPFTKKKELNTIKVINKRFKVTNDCADLALLTGKYLLTCQQSLTKTAEELLLLLQKVDIFRRPERFSSLLQICRIESAISQQDDIDLSLKFLNDLAERVCIVKAKPFIDKGFQGEALGKALSDERLKVIKQIKTAYQSMS